ncbi:metallophosphoesterase [Agromyces sp. NPDC049794]|uniref:metallophosphoesterase n=1 Tax=unclassified Agromyces TaxID=2639701 RepID=UPI0033D6CDF6
MRLRRRLATATFAAVGLALLGGCVGPTGSGDRGSVDASTPPAAPALTFTASGDIGATTESAKTLEQIRSLEPDLHLALGDLSYGETGEEGVWCEFVTDRIGTGIPFQLLSGNHESDGLNGHIDVFADCLPNRLPGLAGEYARQYYVDVPANVPLVRFVMISPGLTFSDGPWLYAPGSERFEWTREAIEGAREAGIGWVVVGMHKPCLSIGNYGCDPGPELVDLLVSSGVDLVVSGHEHLYQRTVQLGIGDGCASIAPQRISAACVVDEGASVDQGGGTVFVTVGTGGTALRDVHTDDPDMAYFGAWSGANAEPSWGNLEVRLTESFLEAEFIAAVGSFADRFRIVARD